MQNKTLITYTKQLRKSQTPAELRLWYHLRAHRFKKLKFKRQKLIGNYIVDFVCLSLKLVIEVDGGQHTEHMEYDAGRTRWLEKQGFRVLRFWNNEMMLQTQEVLAVVEGEVVALSALSRRCAPASNASGRGDSKID